MIPVVSSTPASAAAVTATCQILRLQLGPLDLNLLGLRVQLNRIDLRITGQTGPGNLLGNLLCGIANLLNPPTLGPAGVARLLNTLLGAVTPVA